ERLFSYLQQFERDFSNSRCRIIDATEGGALKRGAEPMSLERALSEFCGRELPTASDDHEGLHWENLEACDDSLGNRFEEAARIARIGEETLPLLEQVRDCIEDQGRVNRLIARIDALRARMMELNDCYELVTQLSQQTE